MKINNWQKYKVANDERLKLLNVPYETGHYLENRMLRENRKRINEIEKGIAEFLLNWHANLIYKILKKYDLTITVCLLRSYFLGRL